MSDLISRQAAIDAIQKAYDRETLLYRFVRGIAVKTLNNLPSAEKTEEWILCSEKMPEEPYGCLVTVRDTNPITFDEFENILPYFVGWDGEQWNNGDGEQCPFEVIAWMPLQKPYKGSERE